MARKKAAAKEPTPVQAIKHQDKRPNIPTREQGAMVADQEAKPKTILYPRDPSLDPQLVWKGKDEQDQKPLEVPAVPIYIQEKIHPQALIEDLRRRAAEGKERQLDLFADFNGLEHEPAKRTEFYRHDQHWTNRLILGDSLLVMTSLAEKERLKGRVQMIYIDPPYGIKFGSNWQVSTRKRDVKDSKHEDLTRQPEQVKAFRDTWQLGIHSYLTYLRDRLTVARELLTESGSVFVQIGDENVHLVRGLMDEVFGAENFVCQIAFVTTGGQSADLLGNVFDFLIWYGKNRPLTKYRSLFVEKELREGGGWAHSRAELEDGSRENLGVNEIRQRLLDGKKIRPYSLDGLASQGTTTSGSSPFTFQGKKYDLPHNSHWKTHIDGMQKLAMANRIEASENSIRFIRFLDDFPVQPIINIWDDTNRPGYIDEKRYVVQTTVKVVERCLLMTTDPGDLVLDPTCGSGTTAYVAEQWGRRWITIDTSRVALALARTRLMAGRFPYYLLADSTAGRKKEADSGGTLAGASGSEETPEAAAQERDGDIRRGFVYKRVPHITLKSIANNPDIKEGMSRAEIDAAIQKHAETEILYDQPYEDKSIVRVSGPFTVESLSPHRVLPAGEVERESAGARSAGNGTSSATDFVNAILDNLRKAGVQNTKRGEKLVFDRLDPYPSGLLQAEGTYTENDKSKRVAVCLGPEFGTVGPELLADAAREAHRGIGFDLLLVCGFAFDPHVAEEGKVIEKQVGKMRVLLVRMNPDLAMGDELLKKTGAGNLFMVFGEPDVILNKEKDGKLTVEVRGVDVFDPTTGEIRSSDPDDIACWFIDSDYNGESFFVRHAYFLTGGKGDEGPYDKLKRALRADIDEAEWSKLYSAKSVPFEAPKKGKIAIKVINHYGDEVLKVYNV
jgi:adenine-specific DNA-methyltransferase